MLGPFLMGAVPSLPAMVIFSYLLNPTLCKRSEKSNEPILRKRRYRRVGGRTEMNSQEGASDRYKGPTRIFQRQFS